MLSTTLQSIHALVLLEASKEGDNPQCGHFFLLDSKEVEDPLVVFLLGVDQHEAEHADELASHRSEGTNT